MSGTWHMKESAPRVHRSFERDARIRARPATIVQGKGTASQCKPLLAESASAGSPQPPGGIWVPLQGIQRFDVIAAINWGAYLSCAFPLRGLSHGFSVPISIVVTEDGIA